MDSVDFRALFEGAPGAYLVLSPSFTIIAVSDAYSRATMTIRAEILGRGIFDVFPDNPELPEASGVRNLKRSLERVVAERRADTMAVQKYDIRLPASEGGGFKEHHWSPVNTPVLGPDGEVRYIIHRVEDVTEFIRLREQGAEQREIADELRTRAGGMEREIYRRAQDLQSANEKLRELQQALEERVDERTEELSRASLALQKSEEQLRQAQKLEAIGRLAGGVAHDFNNLLTVILSYSDVLVEAVAGSPSEPDLEEIRKAGARAAELTRQLLAFSRQQVLEPRVLDLNQVVGNVVKMLERLVGEDIDLRLLCAPDLDRVQVDPGQVEQVLMNLVVNARDAMPKGGKLTIETANVLLDDLYAKEHHGATAGPHVMLAVSDNGAGMSKEVQARIFEPFFTTKEQGRGTGLGLSTVFGIVKQSGGNIWLYSEPGVGTTFKVFLPRATDAPLPESARAPEPRSPVGRETVLLVEDEEQVRLVASKILSSAGYTVIEAESAKLALEVAAAHPSGVDLVLTDVIMPNMSGRELAAKLRETRPETLVVFMSGYTNNMILHHGVLEAGVSFLQKPFTPASLRRKVREVLDAPKAQRRSPSL